MSRFERNYKKISIFKFLRWGSAYLLLGFGSLNLMLGGIVLFSSAKIHLRSEVSPEAPSE